jgi:hypothetical protein
MAHTNDIGLALVEATDDIEEIQLMNWELEEPTPFRPIRVAHMYSVDASDGFSNFIIETSEGSFRVSITRIG